MSEKWERFGAHLETAPGRLSSEIRRVLRARTAATADPGPHDQTELAGFADLVADRSYRVTEQHLAALKAAGHTDDEIFEATAVAAYGAADRRLRAAQLAWEGN
ncbi:carboxymuconolactone decarboxylase family protein [Nocardia exalbida]|uniref:carboxymuconolactone decarboxylase family protein n=1 Tax=Nocardia exalbida TaxID=290231 RepID=UPI000594EEC8|nr:carboxymuconolactone decarboxylase family protein [Nocardia exalbida]